MADPAPRADAPESSHRPGLLTPAVLLTQVPLGYPAEGFRAILDHANLTPQLRIEAAEGRVVLRLLVLVDGTVGRIEIAASSGSQVLDDAAAAAARQWRFAPAALDGSPIDAWVLIPVRFVVP